MNPTPAFQQQQRQFLNYLRRPQTAQLPDGFGAERVTVYVELLYNKFDESLTACFPVIHSLLSNEDWRALLLDFIANHTCHTPYYRQIPDEFLRYLQHERQTLDDWPFLPELAHFEWMELQLSIAESEPVSQKTLSAAELLDYIPILVPVLQLLHYRWPVQDIGPSFLPSQPPETVNPILGFRDCDDQVQFVSLSPATAQLILLLNNGLTGQNALQTMNGGKYPDTQFLEFGRRMLVDLHHQGVIIDARPVLPLEPKS
ncbi:DUF2063 domain-containing protein [Methylomonas sp. TEB]|uniref:HvfC family RiPP maturation protein n=1 Tax=Methylomonas sp. TEB TaxID=3398229 RepID=UPI0039F5B044